MKHSENVEHLTFDVRLTEWNIKNKVITSDELQKHLKTLPDSEGRYEIVKMEDLRKGG